MMKKRMMGVGKTEPSIQVFLVEGWGKLGTFHPLRPSLGHAIIKMLNIDMNVCRNLNRALHGILYHSIRSSTQVLSSGGQR
jgi:hypothetical protein